jgi:hypothetical protein
VFPESLYGSRRPGTHLAAFSSVDIRPGIPPSSALRCTHLNDANRKGTQENTTLRYSSSPARSRAVSTRRRASANAFTASRCRDCASTRCR